MYRSTTEDEALLELDRFSEIWDDQYPQIAKSWRNHWQNLNTLFSYTHKKETKHTFRLLLTILSCCAISGPVISVCAFKLPRFLN